VWRKSCSLWCDTKSGKLHQPLGSWLLPSVSLRRTWPFHLDPLSGNLLVRTLDGYSVHHPFSRGPRGVRFHRDATQHTLTLSSRVFRQKQYRFALDSSASLVQKLQAHFKLSQALPSTTSFLLSHHGLNSSFRPFILNIPIPPSTITYIPQRLP
jgi:hypothetical protein